MGGRRPARIVAIERIKAAVLSSFRVEYSPVDDLSFSKYKHAPASHGAASTYWFAIS
tara:strand:- start:886 stop:1056 length:171 start_codon:yes stop_codon:yes gene_type:complete